MEGQGLCPRVYSLAGKHGRPGSRAHRPEFGKWTLLPGADGGGDRVESTRLPLSVRRHVWIDVGSKFPTTAKKPAGLDALDGIFCWRRHPRCVLGTLFSVLQAGHSGSTRPDFSIPAPERGVDSLSDSTLQWQDFGTSLPSSVSSAGATPSRYMRFPAWWHGMCATGSWTAR